VVHHRPGKRHPLCRSLLVRWKLHGPGKRRRRRDGIAQSNWKAQPNHRASPSELLPKPHNCMRCITFSTDFRPWVDQNWLETVWDRALEAGNGGVRLWIFASTHSFTTAWDMTSHWVERWAGRRRSSGKGGRIAISLVILGLSTNIFLLRFLLLLHSFQNQAVPSPPPKTTCAEIAWSGTRFPAAGDLSSMFFTSAAFVSSSSKCTFNSETSSTHKNYALPLQRRSPPFSSPHPTDPLRYKRFHH
jgi:hypothetical protein